MGKNHEEILERLSPEAVNALIDTPEDGPVLLPGPLGDVVRKELREVEGGPLVRMISGVMGTATILTTCGEVVRYYAMIRKLEDLG